MQCQQAAQSFRPSFPGMPIVLLGQDSISKAVGSYPKLSDQRAALSMARSPKSKGRSLDSLKFELPGCCGNLIDEVNRKLK
jgi:hypothetical protein